MKNHHIRRITRRSFLEGMARAGVSVTSLGAFKKALEREVRAGRLPEIAVASASQDPRRPPLDAQIEEEGMRITAEVKSAFWRWLEAEGIPIYTGISIEDVTKVPLGPWKRLGVLGAAIYLHGDGGQMVGFLWEIPPRERAAPEKHLYEEHILVLSGRGETHVWYDDRSRATARWQAGTLFAIPLNAWHEHVNRGDEPARMIAVTNAPLMLDLFRNLDFIFRNEFRFTDRFDARSDYFRPEPVKTVPPEGHRHAYSITNLVPDVRTVQLFPAGHGEFAQEIGTRDHHFVLAQDALDAHVEEYQPGVYERAHRHGAGDNVLILTGQGYSLMWPATAGERPFAAGNAEKVIRIDWRPMTLFVPPLGWYHQHFNTGETPVRFVKLDGWENRLYPLTSKQTFNQTAIHISYEDEDPRIRELYEQELRRNGVPFRMPFVRRPR